MSNKTKIIIIVLVIVILTTTAIIYSKKRKERAEWVKEKHAANLNWNRSRYDLGAFWFFSQNQSEYNNFVSKLPELGLPTFSEPGTSDYFSKKSNLDAAKQAFTNITQRAIDQKHSISVQLNNESALMIQAEGVSKKEAEQFMIYSNISVTPSGLPGFIG